jgi:hypothetical protein
MRCSPAICGKKRRPSVFSNSRTRRPEESPGAACSVLAEFLPVLLTGKKRMSHETLVFKGYICSENSSYGFYRKNFSGKKLPHMRKLFA